jgi:hypothetical protein
MRKRGRHRNARLPRLLIGAMGAALRIKSDHRGVAQLVEHRSPKPRATGSNPVTPATSRYDIMDMA